MSIVRYGVVAVVILDRATLIDLVPDAVSRVGSWLLAVCTLVVALG